MSNGEKLKELFTKLPGVGPRQAGRFVYYLMKKDKTFSQNLAQTLLQTREEVSICKRCQKIYVQDFSQKDLCDICSDEQRDKSVLMIVANDSDLENIEKNNVFNGKYFIFGGYLKVLAIDSYKKTNIEKLQNLINQDKDLREIILALNFTPEGENTMIFIKESIKEICDKKNIKLSNLGRGLSVGSELEYCDDFTLKNALINRK